MSGKLAPVCFNGMSLVNPPLPKPNLIMNPINPTLYDILGRVPREASQEDIKIAYRTLAKHYHPDKNPHDLAGAAEKMAALNEAYAILSDPIKRSEYNEELRQKDEFIRQQEETNKRQKQTQERNAKARQTAQAHDHTATMARAEADDMASTVAGVAFAGIALGVLLAALLDDDD